MPTKTKAPGPAVTNTPPARRRKAEATPDPKVQARKERNTRRATPPVVDVPPADAPPELVEPGNADPRQDMVVPAGRRLAPQPGVSITPQAAAVVENLAAELTPAADRLERVRLAKAEHAILKAWISDGEKPPRPATPNLDALEAEHAAGGPKPKPAKAASTSTRAPGHPLYAEARAAMKAANNHRGPGTKVTADELTALARELQAQGLTLHQGQEVAYWLRRLAVSRPSWTKAWEAALA